jgi:hypothetical protein
VPEDAGPDALTCALDAFALLLSGDVKPVGFGRDGDDLPAMLVHTTVFRFDALVPLPIEKRADGLSDQEGTVLDAVRELGGSATNYEIEAETGMMDRSVRLAMRRLERKGLVSIDEWPPPAYCCGGGAMTLSADLVEPAGGEGGVAPPAGPSPRRACTSG